MFIKQLRPIHGWRLFFGEVAIIVLGVLIALAAQQAVEAWNWQREAHQAELQLQEESLENFRFAAEQTVVEPCLDAQLDRLLALAVQPGANLQPVPPIVSSVGSVAYRQPSRPYRDDVWNSVVSDGVASHLDRERRDSFASVYTQVDDLRDMAEAGDSAVDALNLLLVPLAVDAGIRARLADVIVSQKSRSRRLALVAAQVMDNLWALGQAPPTAVTDDWMESSGTVQYCRSHDLPLGSWRDALIAERAAAVASGDNTLGKDKHSGRPK